MSTENMARERVSVAHCSPRSRSTDARVLLVSCTHGVSVDPDTGLLRVPQTQTQEPEIEAVGLCVLVVV